MLSFRMSLGFITLLLTVALSSVGIASADDEAMPPIKVDVLQKGSSSGKSCDQALSELPLQQLAPEQRARVESVLKHRSLFRRLPTIGLDAEPAVYDHFIRNPESAVSIWRVLEISQFKIWPTASETWRGDAGDGSIGTIEVLHRTPNSQLLFCEGEYKCPVLPKPIKAQSVMYLRTKFSNDPNKQLITHDLDIFVTFPSMTVDTVAKVIAPVSNTIADKNFRELSMFVQFMSVAMHKQPGWIEHMVQRMEGVKPDQKEELLKLSAQVFVAARKAELEKSGVVATSFDELLAPYQPTKK